MNRTSAVLLVLAIACGKSEPADDPAPSMSFASAPIRVVAGAETLTVMAELAETQDQRTMGLMERRQLPDSAGMLFIYSSDQPATSGFWMFRTRIPLDIAFVDSTGVIRAVRNMVPCTAELAQGCPTYEPGASYRAALEVNPGYLARHKLGVGSRIILADTSRRVAR